MASDGSKQGGGFFASIAAGWSTFGSAMSKSVNGLLGYEGLEVVNPEGSTEDAEDEARRGRWKQEERDNYWKMMQKYIGADVQSLVTLPVFISEPNSVLQRMAELMEYSHLLDLADECEDPYMRLVYASSWALSIYFAYRRAWKPFNPVLGETFEMVNHGGVTFIAEQVSHHPPMSAGHAENEHFIYDVTSKLRTKFLGNSIDVYPVGRSKGQRSSLSASHRQELGIIFCSHKCTVLKYIFLPFVSPFCVLNEIDDLVHFSLQDYNSHVVKFPSVYK